MVVDAGIAEIGERQALQAGGGFISGHTAAAEIFKKATQCLFVHRLHCAGV